MTYRILSEKDKRIFKAMGQGIIPRGGRHFELGAIDLAEKWLPRTDYLLSRMNRVSRTGFRLLIRGINLLWPLFYLKRFHQMTALSEEELVLLFHRVESSNALSAAVILFIKVLICPSFYGLEEVKAAISYREKFPNPKEYEGLKA